MIKKNYFDSFNQEYKIFLLSKQTENNWVLIIHKYNKIDRNYSNILLENISIIFTIIFIEMMVGLVFAKDFLIHPLEKLSQSVSEWHKGQKFISNRNRYIPSEIRQLERSFLRAIRHLKIREEKLKKSTNYQEHLIHEIHHRVKNNLQIIASLLNLHANRVKSLDAREEFHLVRDRVRAISMMHHHLYESDQKNHLKSDIFIPELANSILISHNQKSKERFDIHYDIDDILIPTTQSSPITLIITEIISNHSHYTRPYDGSGAIFISFKYERQAHIKHNVALTLTDNRTEHTAKELSTHHQDGIGRQLIRGFARQLHADLTIEHDESTTYRLTFLLAPLEMIPPTVARRTLSERGTLS
ncbi:sensor histidine kinase [Neokomagataea thailandica]|uniref:histidine kinase n=1 Tax=Neokomagataea tanensis NBRC 106556 TaxID=1223519 RepID=A0ABQ0QK95_9PROT|nr:MULTISPECIES: sensor histidine kinase [Neokomagataea]GBR47742.1 hypothetical protein AA106556_1560 [Neokomagataea tanensis NBRC 106556]